MTRTKSQVDEINRTLHEFNGGCVHSKEPSGIPPYTGFPMDKFQCDHCKQWIYAEDFNRKLPDYYSNLNLLREVELKLSHNQQDQYEALIWDESCPSFVHHNRKFVFLIAPANIIAPALCEVIKTIKQEN